MALSVRDGHLVGDVDILNLCLTDDSCDYMCFAGLANATTKCFVYGVTRGKVASLHSTTSSVIHSRWKHMVAAPLRLLHRAPRHISNLQMLEMIDFGSNCSRTANDPKSIICNCII